MVEKKEEQGRNKNITQIVKVKTLNRIAEIPLICDMSFDKAVNALINSYEEKKK